MNHRQKKKYWKNHVLLKNRETGALHTITMKDYEALLKIAGMTKEEHVALSLKIEAESEDNFEHQRYIKRWLKDDTKGTRHEFCGDIRHFYDNPQPEVVMNRMRQLIKDRRTLDLIEGSLGCRDDGGEVRRMTDKKALYYFKYRET